MNEEIKTGGNAEIEQALKEFEAKEAVPSYQAVKFYNETDTPKIVKLAMKWTGVKEQKQAEYVLLAFIIIAMLISFYLFFGQTLLSKFSSKKQIPQDQMMELYPELIIP